MLFDPRHDMRSVNALRDWIGRQPQDKTYNYSSCSDCLLAQYFREKTGQRVTVSASSVYMHGRMEPLPPHFNKIAAGDPTSLYASTFSGALERADKVLEAQYA